MINIVTLKSNSSIYPKAGPTCDPEVPQRAAGCGGETLSEVCFLSDLWKGPGISSVFNWAG